LQIKFVYGNIFGRVFLKHNDLVIYSALLDFTWHREDKKMDLVKALSEQHMKTELPPMNVGDTVRVTVRVKEGNRERNQAFEGTIIAKKHGGINETITVRRISYNVGCEKVFPVHSPTIVSVDTVRRGKVRRAKLYYLRDKIGKKAKVKERV